AGPRLGGRPGGHGRAGPPGGGGRRPAGGGAVHGWRSGPPIAIRTSGRFESRSSDPYRGPSAREHVAVTPAPASAATSSRTLSRQPATSAPEAGVSLVPAPGPEPESVISREL